MADNFECVLDSNKLGRHITSNDVLNLFKNEIKSGKLEVKDKDRVQECLYCGNLVIVDKVSDIPVICNDCECVTDKKDYVSGY